MTLNDNSLSCRQYYACCDKMAEVESRGFRYVVAYTCVLNLTTKLKGNSFEFQA